MEKIIASSEASNAEELVQEMMAFIKSKKEAEKGWTITLAVDYQWYKTGFCSPWIAYIPNDAIGYNPDITTEEIVEALDRAGYYCAVPNDQSSFGYICPNDDNGKKQQAYSLVLNDMGFHKL